MDKLATKKIIIVIASFASFLFIGISLYSYHRYNKWYELYVSDVPYKKIQKAHLSDLTDDSISYYYLYRINDIKSKRVLKYKVPKYDNYELGLFKKNSPVRVAQYALDNFNIFLSNGSQKSLEIFLLQCDWLVENQKLGIWYYNFDFPYQSMKDPWYSAMAQGQCISALLRAYQLTNNIKYMDASKKAFECFKLPVDNNGVACKDGQGIWFEEYPHVLLSPSHVMNGHIFALFGLWDLYRVNNDPEVFRLFQEGVNSLKHNLSSYDMGFWVLYDLKSDSILTKNYLLIEIEQLKVLYSITKEPLFSDYAIKWQHIYNNPKLYDIIIHLGRSKLYRVFSFD